MLQIPYTYSLGRQLIVDGDRCGISKSGEKHLPWQPGENQVLCSRLGTSYAAIGRIATLAAGYRTHSEQEISPCHSHWCVSRATAA